MTGQGLSRIEIRQTKGLAILSMIFLHLFCRKGVDVYGTPLLWVSSDTPLVYYLGFLSEICVPMYCLCRGYAHYRLGQSGGLSAKRNIKRGFKFPLNYWIVLVIFSLMGLVVQSNRIPGSLGTFLGNAFLYHVLYNGAWWFVPTYILLLCISYGTYLLVKRLHWVVLFGIGSAELLFFALFGSQLFSAMSINYVMERIAIQVQNLSGWTIFSYVAGMVLAKYSLISKVRERMSLNCLPLIILAVVSVGLCVIHKAILVPYYAILVFVILNVWKKPKVIVNTLNFLGTHSTNIWLVHMFFYLTLFPGLVQKLQYPVLMVAGMLIICVLVSYVVNFVYYKVLSIPAFQRSAL